VAERIDLDAIEARANAATPGPWHARYLDDESSRSLLGVSTKPDTGLHETFGGAHAETMVAVTMDHYLAQHTAQRWSEDAEFIACARTDVPVLVAEVRRLRRIEWAARHVHDGAALEPLLTRERVEAHMHARGWTRGEERATGGHYWIHAEHDPITLPLRPSRVWWQSHFALGGYDVSDAIAVLADMLPEHGEWENVHG